MSKPTKEEIMCSFCYWIDINLYVYINSKIYIYYVIHYFFLSWFTHSKKLNTVNFMKALYVRSTSLAHHTAIGSRGVVFSVKNSNIPSSGQGGRGG